MDTEDKLTPIIEELARVLEGNVTRDDLEKEVTTNYYTYGITDLERIKNAIIRKHTAAPRPDAFVTADHVMKKIGELTGNENNADIVAKVVFAEKKMITSRGQTKPVISGILGDDTGTASFTIWDGENCSVEKGKVYRFKSVYTKLWNDRVQINIGSRGSIMVENADIEVGGNISSRPSQPAETKKIGELTGTETSVNVEVKAVFTEKKEVSVRGEPRSIISGIVGDETGTAQFTVWDATGVEMEKGRCYTLKNVYTKLWNDRMQINIGNSGRVEPSDRNVDTADAPAQAQTSQAPAVQKKIGDLTGEERNVDILAKVLIADIKDVTVKGEPRTIVSGLLGDDTATAQFTAWDASRIELEKGRSYIIRNAYTRLWNDRVQINIGNSGSAEPAEDVKVIDRPQPASFASKEMKIKDLKEGVGSVTVSGKVLSLETRKVMSQGTEKTVWSGLLADDTGKIQFSSWNELPVEQGDSMRAANAYIRSWKGIPQLNISEKSEVTKTDEDFGDISASTEKTIGNIVKTGGGIDITVTGTIVELRKGSGIIKRCPECRRSILGNECMTHGAVEPVSDLRMKVVIDDGTGAMNAIADCSVTEKITGISLREATDIASMKNDPECVAKMLEEKIIFRRVTLSGNVMSDDYGPSMIVKNAQIAAKDVAGDAEKLLDTVQEAMQ